jgi:hypothetical protein
MAWQQHPSVQIYRGFDLGFSPDPAYCVWIAHVGNRFIVFKEKLWLKTVAADIAKDIVAESEGMKVAMTYCDPVMDVKTAADVRSIKDIFEENGVPMEASINNREHYAHAVHGALQEEVIGGVDDEGNPVMIPRLQILDRTPGLASMGCPYLIKTIPQMRYDPKHPLRMADSKNDHGVIALAYFLISSGAIERRNANTLYKLPKWMRPKDVGRNRNFY